MKTSRVVAVSVVSLLFVAVAIAGLAFVALWMFNPLGDEWQCSEGEAPVEYADGGSNCVAVDGTLPEGGTWHPLGNRPMSYNCGNDGWAPVEDLRGPEVLDDCISIYQPVPEGFRLVTN